MCNGQNSAQQSTASEQTLWNNRHSIKRVEIRTATVTVPYLLCVLVAATAAKHGARTVRVSTRKRCSGCERRLLRRRKGTNSHRFPQIGERVKRVNQMQAEPAACAWVALETVPHKPTLELPLRKQSSTRCSCAPVEHFVIWPVAASQPACDWLEHTGIAVQATEHTRTLRHPTSREVARARTFACGP